MKLTLDYYACSDAEGWCRHLVQEYTIHLKRDPFGGGVMGRSFTPGKGFGGNKPKGNFKGGPPAGGFRGGPPSGIGGNGPRDPAMLFQRFDKNKDKNLTEDELPSFLWGRVSAADKNKDGQLALKEMKSFSVQSQNSTPPTR